MSLVIKENCWKWDTATGSYFMKYYEDLWLAQKVKFIHGQLQKIAFPFHVALERNEDEHIIKQRWIEGKSANYEQFSDRAMALKALQTLHETEHEINWLQFEGLPSYDLSRKWHRRFERFVENESALTTLLGQNYKEIVKQAQWSLKQIEQMPKTKESVTLLHGDVVHHNVMINGDDVKLVDFDLAALGAASDELILWLHRALAQTDYQLTELMQAHPYLQNARHKLFYLNYPNEIMRESLFYLKLNERQKLACYPFIQSIVKDWVRNKEQLAATIQTLKS